MMKSSYISKKQKEFVDERHSTEEEEESIKIKAAHFINQSIEYLTEDYLNKPTNPPNWPGENGKAVIIPDYLKGEAKKRFVENQFNIIASELTAINRSLPDCRSKECKLRKYPTNLPTTSIIIVLHNEANSTLLRGLTSIINRSPLRYLKEIIIIDDASQNRNYLYEPLEIFLKTLPVKTKLIHNSDRIGLIRSRLRGAKLAEGDTMTFLDAHIEVTNGWLPPLLNEIRLNRKSVVCPIIDSISDDDLEYFPGSEHSVGGFDGELVFNWDKISERIDMSRNYDISASFMSPTMAGGLFTIERKYFYELGSYDEGMNIWGAENVEISLRIWMCGGVLLFSPCSHVGHIFRKQSPYTFPGGADKIIRKNNRRLIDVWTDEYKYYFYKLMPDIKHTYPGDLSERIQLRKDLKCKSFRWFLENIYPEAPLPINFYHVGEIKNNELNYCLDALINGKLDNKMPGVYPCHGEGTNQMMEYSKFHCIVKENYCFDLEKTDLPTKVKFSKCNIEKLSQKWIYDNEGKFFKNQETKGCLTINKLNLSILVVTNCNKKNILQRWNFANSAFNSRYTYE